MKTTEPRSIDDAPVGEANLTGVVPNKGTGAQDAGARKAHRDRHGLLTAARLQFPWGRSARLIAEFADHAVDLIEREPAERFLSSDTLLSGFLKITD